MATLLDRALDNSLRDICKVEQQPFGGKIVVLSGDFRQILPVKEGYEGRNYRISLPSSSIWPLFLKITNNQYTIIVR